MSSFADIPGGRAELFDKTELTARRKRPGKLLMTAHADLIQRVASAAIVTSPDGRVEFNKHLTGAELTLTEADALILDRLQDASTWALLKGWDLDLPVPESPDELLDLPDELYEALKQAAVKAGVGVDDIADLFEAPEDGDGVLNSPTGASVALLASSGAVKNVSPRKPRNGSKSTGASKRSAGPTTRS